MQASSTIVFTQYSNVHKDNCSMKEEARFKIIIFVGGANFKAPTARLNF
jgi:hypothetical protein